MTETASLGLQKVEHFCDGSISYYRCCLCMVHSNSDAMYRHLIGDKHTDKYIKFRLVLKKGDITAYEREQLRHIIYNKENYTGSSIVSIIGKNYFPYYLLKSNFKAKEYARIGEPSTSNAAYNHFYEVGKTEDMVPKVSSSTQTDFPIEDYNDILNKFAYMIKTDHLKRTKLESPDDLRLTLIVMVFALHWIFFVNESFLSEKVNVDHHKEQKNLITGCLGHVIMKLGEAFRCKFPHLKLALD